MQCIIFNEAGLYKFTGLFLNPPGEQAIDKVMTMQMNSIRTVEVRLGIAKTALTDISILLNAKHSDIK